MKKKNKGFTLIELVAVLVILAILALIVTPLVLNIIRKARTSADKRSIDAYGRSIELAVADYLLDKGTFPTSIEELTIEYTGDEVVCSQAQLKSDSSVYLAGCKVGGRSVDYTYGKEETATYEEYSVGDIVQYNGANYYVIKDSSTSEETVRLLKAEPLTYIELNIYNSNSYLSGQYSQADFERVRNWALDNFDSGLKSIDLITIEELKDNIGCSYAQVNITEYRYSCKLTQFNWIYNDNYGYWTDSFFEDDTSSRICVEKDGTLYHGQYGCAYRPVVEVIKSAL